MPRGCENDNCHVSDTDFDKSDNSDPGPSLTNFYHDNGDTFQDRSCDDFC